MPSKIALGTLMEVSISKRGFKGLFDVVIVKPSYAGRQLNEMEINLIISFISMSVWMRRIS